MRYSLLTLGALVLLNHPALTSAQSTTTSATASCTKLTNPLPKPSLAAGYDWQLVATGLKYPRSVQFDKAGNLLVLDRGVGVVRYMIDDCMLGVNNVTVVADTKINHGMTLSDDGSTLFVSDSEAAYSYRYNAADGTVTDKTTLVTGMNNADHITRTLLISKQAPDMLLVSRGSNDNVDNETIALSSGRSQIRAFNVSEIGTTSVDYSTSGTLFGWGLRNSVGLAEDGMGQIWSVENSADEVHRNGVDIHEHNPAEEMNYHGLITDKTTRGNYGYPVCFAVWNVTDFPDAGDLETGDQFVFNPDSTLNDTTCAEDYHPPRLAFQAHMAPLDIEFDGAGNAWISFHGSWDKTDPAGYKIATVEFQNYEPTAANDSMSAAVDIISNADNSVCPGECFRPVGITFDSKGRLFFASDSTGEIYMVRKSDGTGVAATTSSSSTSSIVSSSSSGTATQKPSGTQTQGATTTTNTGAAVATTSKPAAGVRQGVSAWMVAVVAVGIAILMV